MFEPISIHLFLNFIWNVFNILKKNDEAVYSKKKKNY